MQKRPKMCRSSSSGARPSRHFLERPARAAVSSASTSSSVAPPRRAPAHAASSGLARARRRARDAAALEIAGGSRQSSRSASRLDDARASVDRGPARCDHRDLDGPGSAGPVRPPVQARGEVGLARRPSACGVVCRLARGVGLRPQRCRAVHHERAPVPPLAGPRARARRPRPRSRRPTPAVRPCRRAVTRHPADIDPLGQHVARRAGHVGDDRARGPDERIEQAGLARRSAGPR